MATFNVSISTKIIKRAEVQIDITKKKLVDEGLLKPSQDWKDTAKSYIYMNIEDLIDKGDVKWYKQPFDPSSDQWDFEEDGIECDDVTCD
jgi:hypothetical protein